RVRQKRERRSGNRDFLCDDLPGGQSHGDQVLGPIDIMKSKSGTILAETHLDLACCLWRMLKNHAAISQFPNGERAVEQAQSKIIPIRAEFVPRRPPI